MGSGIEFSEPSVFDTTGASISFHSQSQDTIQEPESESRILNQMKVESGREEFVFQDYPFRSVVEKVETFYDMLIWCKNEKIEATQQEPFGSISMRFM